MTMLEAATSSAMTGIDARSFSAKAAILVQHHYCPLELLLMIPSLFVVCRHV
jgi:hypothetical protein